MRLFIKSGYIPLLIFITAGLFTLDLFLHQGEPATFDGPIHITNIAMYHTALRDGDLPVTWADGFANYGLPTPLISQQLTSYLGALIMYAVPNPVLVLKLLFFLSTLVGGFATYHFLKLHTSPPSALFGTLLFSFTAYRITNLYIRGALPELFAISLIPFLLISLNKLAKNERNGFTFTVIATTATILTHPFIFFISLFLTLPYFFSQVTSKTPPLHKLSQYVIAHIIAFGLSSWYLTPLLFEMKYFVIARHQSQLVTDQFLNFSNYFQEIWAYYSASDTFVRANRLQFGIIETLVIFIGTPLLWFLNRRTKQNHHLLRFITLTALLFIILTTSLSLPLYKLIPFLGNIQFPWRFLSVLLFIPPLVLALILDRARQKTLVGSLIIITLLLFRLPQVYGKNFIQYPLEHYTHTLKNLHFDSLNTIWMGNAASYPPQTFKGHIIEGEGVINSRVEKNSFRLYHITASTPVKMADYTFYFPGWQVSVDNQPIPIEFQDINYRGIITYQLPAGEHQVTVSFKPTKTRVFSYLLTLSSAIVFAITLLVPLRFG